VSSGREIRLVENEDGWWTAIDEETGAVSQGPTRGDALANLDEAIAGLEGEGHQPTSEELEELGVDPDVAQSGAGELPDVLQ
jgi:predicted RNase H-like HicB family nuclease